jgi:hypothetical protein
MAGGRVMPTATYSLPEGLKEAVEGKAEELGLSASSLASKWLQEGLGKQFKPKRSKPKVQVQPIDYEVAAYILQGIRRIKPDYKQPDMNAWADHCRKMRELDKRTPRQIAEVFRWANHDSFWQTNILGPDKLRKQFDQLELKSKQEKTNGQADQSITTHTGWNHGRGAGFYQPLIQQDSGDPPGMAPSLPEERSGPALPGEIGMVGRLEGGGPEGSEDD